MSNPIKTVKQARALRREMTLPEVLLWRELKQRPGGFKFRKQTPLHPFSLDFACLSVRLCVEVDGEAHDRGDQPARDQRRDAYVAEQGFETLRIPARYVLRDLDGAITAIVAACRARAPSTTGPEAGGPPPRSGEE